MNYRCLRHLETATKGDKIAFLNKSLSLLKAIGKTENEALTTLSVSLTTGDGQYPELIQAVQEELDGRGRGAYQTAVRKYCPAMLEYLGEKNIHCACEDCCRYKGAKGKTYDNNIDEAILRWCVCDYSFYDRFRDNKRYASLIRKGLLGSPIQILSKPDYSLTVPLYKHIYSVLSGIPYQISMAEKDGHTGLDEAVYDVVQDTVLHILAPVLEPLTEEYRQCARENVNRLLSTMADRNQLMREDSVLARLETFGQPPVPEEAERGGAGEKTTHTDTAILEEQKEVFLATMGSALPDMDWFPDNPPEPPKKSGQTHIPPATPKTEPPKPEPPKTEPVPQPPSNPKDVFPCIYPYDITDKGFEILDNIESFTRLFYLLVENQCSRLPMEIIRSGEDIYALIYLSTRYHPDGQYYLIPEYTFPVLAKSRVFTKAKPLCFLPFAVLSYFPSLRKCYSLLLAYNAFYMKETIPDRAGILADILSTTPPKGADRFLFPFLRYTECYERILSLFGERERDTYRRYIHHAVYQSTSYRMQYVHRPPASETEVLFGYTGREYVYFYNLHSLTARDGYTKYRIIIRNLKSGHMNEIIDWLAENYCTHSLFRTITLCFIGAIYNRNELDFVVPVNEEHTFLEIAYLDFLRLSEQLSIADGHPDILFQKED